MAMKKLFCGLLCVLMLVSMLAVGAVSASAASSFTTSEPVIEILKELEGFSKTAYKDNGQWSIGYGSGCNPIDYPNGITEAEADALLRKYLADFEKTLNSFIDRYSLNLTQNQFDALILFSYNCGAGWTGTDSDFRTAVISGATGNDFIYYITRWCTASQVVNTNLISRRLAEADLYLYGYYNKKAPSNYSYVLLDANGGSSESPIQGYDAADPTTVRVVPYYTGYRFLGWYTKAEGGEWITDLDKTTMELTLYAHWQKDEGNVDAEGNIQGSDADYQRNVGNESISVYAEPSVEAEELEVLTEGTVSIVADYIDAEGAKWGRLASGGWVILNDTTVDVNAAAVPTRPQKEETGVTVTITGSKVNVRSGAGTDYTVLGTVKNGDKVTITETVMVDNVKWGKFSNGWICLTYTNYDQVVTELEVENTEVIATGIVTNCSVLRVRSGPGMEYSAVGSLTEGMKVEIYEVKTVGSTSWGRISSGWVSLNYVNVTYLTPETGEDEPETTEPEETEPETTEPKETEPKETEPEATEPEETEPEENGKTENTGVTGTVISNSNLNIRSGAGTGYGAVGSYARGTVVTILEQTTGADGAPWGRTDKGWVCLYYVKLNVTEDTTPDSSGESGKMSGVVSCSSYLHVRSGPGTTYRVVTSLKKGTAVVIYETRLVGSTTWGRVDNGWISLSYVKLDENVTGDNTGKPETGADDSNSGSGASEPDSGSGDTNAGADTTGGEIAAKGHVVNANSLRIRSGPGTGYTSVGSLSMGAKVELYETKTVDGVVWGRISKGWICMSYVQIDSTNGSIIVMTGTITASNLRIRTAAGTQNAIVGYYSKGTTVELYETITVGSQAWGRTADGWISLEYVK